MGESIRRPRIVLGLIGASIGGYLGFLAFYWIARQGFYALIVPAGLLGLAGGYGVRQRSVPFAIACGFAGLALGLFTEWHFTARIANHSFGYFVTHLYLLKPIKLFMLAISPVISYRLALGLDEKSTPANGNV